MNFIRLAAFLAVAMTFFACEQNRFSKQTAEAETQASKEISFIEEKPGLVDQHDPGTGFQADSAGRQQTPGDKQKQQQRQQAAPALKQDWDRKIIKTASLNLEIKDYSAFSTSLREKIRNHRGYVAQENQSQSDYKIESSITVKVPVDQFDDAVAAFTSGSEKVNEKKISSQDVTTEVVDTRSRMEAKKQVRLRYLDLLKQAKNMEEILSVQSQVNGIQEEIESAAGRMQYLGHSTVFSTIHLTYYQVLNSSAKDPGQPSFGTRFVQALKTGMSWVSDLFIALVSIWPLFLLLFGAVVIYRRTRSRKPEQA